LKSFFAIGLGLLICFLAGSAAAQDAPAWEVQALSHIIPGTVAGVVDYDPVAGTAAGTNGVYVKYGPATLTADSASVNTKTGDVVADGHVRIESGGQLWVGEQVHYNFLTQKLATEQFRTGRFPVYATGERLTGDGTNHLYAAEHATVTTDDYSDPTFQVHASRIVIVPGQYVAMWNAVLYARGVPVFYFPYYHRNLGGHANNWTFMPGYRSTYGAFLLNSYNWYLGDDFSGKLHADYRMKRGPGLGPEIHGRLPDWGDFSLKYYYTVDQRPDTSTNGFPQAGAVPKNRQMFKFSWQATPATNLNLKALVNYQSDPLMLHDFFEGDYAGNPQPNTFVEANKYWDNWSLDALTTPRVNSFFNQVERLPDVRLMGYKQQVGNTPVYYDSQSSFGWYEQWAAYTNSLYPNTNGYYASQAARGDTYHQLTLPWLFFHWLNVTPRVGGRVTYYSSQNFTNGAPNTDTYREVFNTGVGVSFKSSRLWAGATNSVLEVDGLRHIVEPSADYVYIPDPSTPPAALPLFDAEQPSLMLLPVTFPAYNDLDSIDAQNAIRFGLRNTLQTQRDGQLDNLLSVNLQMDLRLDPKSDQERAGDLYSAVAFKPRTWITAESQMRYDVNHGNLNLAFEQITLAPGDRWSWGLGYWYLDGSVWGNSKWYANNFVTSTYAYRLGDNWGLRMTDNFNQCTGRLQDQFYTIYRDLRSWTSALTFRISDDTGGSADFTVAFVLSLKAAPVASSSDDVVNRYTLVGE
jgi:LPS-assembly protein